MSPTSPVSPSISTPITERKNTRSRRRIIVASHKPRRLQKKIAKPVNFKWAKNKKFLHKVIVDCFERNDLPNESITASSPLDYFSLFITNEIIEYIVQQTNLYSTQSKGKSIDVSVDEMKDFFAIKLLMGIIKLPAYTDYWNNDLRIPNVANIMSLKRYQQIRRYLHFVDNNEDDGDRYFKIRLLLDMVREFFLKYEEGQKFSIDEMMIPYKGKKAGSRKQYMKMKPSKWGFKMFA